MTSQTQFPILITQVVTDQFGNPVTASFPDFIPVTTALFVIPTINRDDTVTMLLLPLLQRPTLVNLGGQQIPRIDIQNVSTLATVRDGETVALGGLVDKTTSSGGLKVPYLSRLPLVGPLFKTNANSIDDTELLIFVTPHVLHRAQSNVPAALPGGAPGGAVTPPGGGAPAPGGGGQ
jgi:type II secretory pathway component HofQ